MNITKNLFEEHLNKNSPSQGDEQWIIAGKLKMEYMIKRKYGTALRKYDPNQFDILYNEWARKTINYKP